MARPRITAAAPMSSSTRSGAPVKASGPDDAAAAVLAAVGVTAAAVVAGAVVGGEVAGVELGDVLTVGCGQEAMDVPPRATSMPQMVIGIVTPVPGLPGVPIGPTCVPAPVQVPLALPSTAAVTAHTVTGTLTGTLPVGVVFRWVGSHWLLAVPSTATTMEHALIGSTPSMGALWLTSLVGRSLTSGKPSTGMHMPLALPSTTAITPHAVIGA